MPQGRAGRADVVDEQKAQARRPPRSLERAAQIPHPLLPGERCLRGRVVHLPQKSPLAPDARALRQTLGQQRSLVESPLPHLSRVGGHGNDRVERPGGPFAPTLLEKPRERRRQEIMTLELEGMDEPLQPFTIMTPRLDPLERLPISPRALEAEESRGRLLHPAPRQRAPAASRAGNPGERRPAGGAAGSEPPPPGEILPADHAWRGQNDSQRLPSKVRDAFAERTHRTIVGP